jgi:hypothetical protein
MFWKFDNFQTYSCTKLREKVDINKQCIYVCTKPRKKLCNSPYIARYEQIFENKVPRKNIKYAQLHIFVSKQRHYIYAPWGDCKIPKKKETHQNNSVTPSYQHQGYECNRNMTPSLNVPRTTTTITKRPPSSNVTWILVVSYNCIHYLSIATSSYTQKLTKHPCYPHCNHECT